MKYLRQIALVIAIGLPTGVWAQSLNGIAVHDAKSIADRASQSTDQINQVAKSGNDIISKVKDVFDGPGVMAKALQGGDFFGFLKGVGQTITGVTGAANDVASMVQGSINLVCKIQGWTSPDQKNPCSDPDPTLTVLQSTNAATLAMQKSLDRLTDQFGKLNDPDSPTTMKDRADFTNLLATTQVTGQTANLAVEQSKAQAEALSKQKQMKANIDGVNTTMNAACGLESAAQCLSNQQVTAVSQ